MSKYTEAQKKATMKYMKNNLDQIVIRVPKGEKAKLKQKAIDLGYDSLTQFILAAIEKM